MTILELVVVATIIAMLATMVVLNTLSGYERGLHAIAKQRLFTVATAIRMYEIDTGSLPNQLTDLTTTETLTGKPYVFGTSKNPPYFYPPGSNSDPQIPLDPFLEQKTLASTQKYFRWNKTNRILSSVGPDETSATADDICFSVSSMKVVPCY